MDYEASYGIDKQGNRLDVPKPKVQAEPVTLPAVDPADWKDASRLQAMDTFLRIMSDPRANHSARVAAASALLDRIDGKPVQQVHISKRSDIVITMLERIKQIDSTAVEVLPAPGDSETQPLPSDIENVQSPPKK